MIENSHQKPEKWSHTLNESVTSRKRRILGEDQAPDESNFYVGFPIRKYHVKKRTIALSFIIVLLFVLSIGAIFFYFPGD